MSLYDAIFLPWRYAAPARYIDGHMFHALRVISAKYVGAAQRYALARY